MWICLNKAFLSVVAHRDNKDLLLVRARRPGDIERVFPGVVTFTDHTADYFWRAEIPRAAVAEVMALEVKSIDYANFKSSVKDDDLHDAYMAFWSIMFRVQNKLKGVFQRRPVSKHPLGPMALDDDAGYGPPTASRGRKGNKGAIQK